jgi:hypothetical protein
LGQSDMIPSVKHPKKAILLQLFTIPLFVANARSGRLWKK